MHSVVPAKPVLAFTIGDVNGIGPEILVKALEHPEIARCCVPIVFGSCEAFEIARAQFAPGCPPGQRVESLEDALAVRERIPVHETSVPAPKIQFGVLDPEAGRAAIEAVRLAATLAIDGRIDGLVTGPINKEALARAGYTCAGHTDFIAALCGVDEYRMCLFAGEMRVVHITGHLSLRNALDAVRKDRIAASIRVGHEALCAMGIAAPRIAVAGLNPHAGEAGAFGREEIEEVAPAIDQCRVEGIQCTGPHPPDTVFRRMRLGEFDMVIALYHDQGHIPMKLIAMEEGVNVTLGIPIVRTSVDHGTAFDIAGMGIASESSLIAAAQLAAQLTRKPVAVC